MNRPEGVLPAGTCVRTHDPLDSAEGLQVAPSHVAARRAGASGTIAGIVIVHRGEGYWIRHQGSEILAAYWYSEFDREESGDAGDGAALIAA